MIHTRNAELTIGTLISYHDEIFKVISFNNNTVEITNLNHDLLTINHIDWRPILVNKKWLEFFNLDIEQFIPHFKTGALWKISKSGLCYYFCIDNLCSPIISINYVHLLHDFLMMITNTTLDPDLQKLECYYK